MTFKFFYLNFCFFRLFLDYTHFRWFSFLIFSISYGLCFLFSPHFMVLNFLKIFPLKKSFGNSIVTSGYILGLGLGLRSSQLKTFFFCKFWNSDWRSWRIQDFCLLSCHFMKWIIDDALLQILNMTAAVFANWILKNRQCETTKGQRGS